MFDIDQTPEDEPHPFPKLLNAVLAHGALQKFAPLLGGVPQMALLSAVAKKTRRAMFAEAIPMMHRTYCDHQPDVKQSERRPAAPGLRRLRAPIARLT